MKLTYAFCTYNRSHRLPELVKALAAQRCPGELELLAVDNNSSDDTTIVLERLAKQSPVHLRLVRENAQGIVHARNRAIAEALDRDVLIFIDDDELPDPGLSAAVCDAIGREGAHCVGGRIAIDYAPFVRPGWMNAELEGFLGRIDYGNQPLWVENDKHPLWSGNIAYDMTLFRNDPALRFDIRYNRAGEGIGGGEDAMMFRELLNRKLRIRYRPDMSIRHLVDPWKLRRKYFLELHFRAGVRFGQHRLEQVGGEMLGIPPWLVRQLLVHTGRWCAMAFLGREGSLRQGMNVAHTFGTLCGYRQRAAQTSI